MMFPLVAGATAKRAMSIDEELEDKLEEHSVSDDHIAALFSEEHQMQFPSSLLSPSMLVRRSEVLAFLQKTLAHLVLPADDMFFVAQLLDHAGLWFVSDLRVQVVSAMAALYMCIKLRSDQREPVPGVRLRALTACASQFLEQGTDRREVLPEEMVKEEMQLLASLNFLLPTTTVATWIEVFFQPGRHSYRREPDASPQVRGRRGQGSQSEPGVPGEHFVRQCSCVQCVVSRARPFAIDDCSLRPVSFTDGWMSPGTVQVGGCRRPQFNSCGAVCELWASGARNSASTREALYGAADTDRVCSLWELFLGSRCVSNGCH